MPLNMMRIITFLCVMQATQASMDRSRKTIATHRQRRKQQADQRAGTLHSQRSTSRIGSYFANAGVIKEGDRTEFYLHDTDISGLSPGAKKEKYWPRSSGPSRAGTRSQRNHVQFSPEMRHANGVANPNNINLDFLLIYLYV